jgi:hypothetical protein
VKTLNHAENIYLETSLENFLTVLQFLYSMTRGMTLTLSDSTAQLFACKQSTLSFSKGWYLFVSYFFVIYKAWIHRLCSAKSDGFMKAWRLSDTHLLFLCVVAVSSSFITCLIFFRSWNRGSRQEDRAKDNWPYWSQPWCVEGNRWLSSGSGSVHM